MSTRINVNMQTCKANTKKSKRNQDILIRWLFVFTDNTSFVCIAVGLGTGQFFRYDIRIDTN